VPRQAVLARALYGSGGVQGLDWYADTMRVDVDGDVAHGFLSGDGGGGGDACGAGRGSRGTGAWEALPSAVPPSGCSVEVARVDRATGLVVFVVLQDRPARVLPRDWGVE